MRGKPLTLEELKALETDEWLWISEPNTFFGDLSSYRQKSKSSTARCFAYDIPCADEYGNNSVEIITLKYSEYGKTWIAYKSKEQSDEDYTDYQAKYLALHKAVISICDKLGDKKYLDKLYYLTLGGRVQQFENLAEEYETTNHWR